LALTRAADPAMKAALQRDIDELGVEIALDELTARDPQGPAIAEAHAQLRKLGEMLAVRPDAVLGVQVVIELAIHHGAPIYNLGSHIGCAFIYDYAARLILRTLDGASRMEAPLPAIRKRFAAVGFQPITPMSANKRAWELRQAFDEVLELLSRPETKEPAGAKPGDMTDAGRRTVFVSYASPDRVAAERLVESLEGAGIPCWIAPRNVPMGANYGGSIMDAITTTDVTLVLLSAQANASAFIPNEIERSVSYGKRIVTVRIEPVTPSRNLELFLGPRHWIDLFEDDPHIGENSQRLVNTLLQVRAEAAGGSSGQ
jgi:hypothetical protein